MALKAQVDFLRNGKNVPLSQRTGKNALPFFVDTNMVSVSLDVVF
jgi:hypothetical protein